MQTIRGRRIVGCLLVVAICVGATASPAYAVAVENETIPTKASVSIFESAFGALSAWLDAVWRPLSTFWAMDGAKINEGG